MILLILRDALGLYSALFYINWFKTLYFYCILRKITVNFQSMLENLQKYRFLQAQLPAPNARRLVLITGARQTGKTTLARKIYRDLNYINLDAPENRELVREIPSASWGRDIGQAIIDEAQKEPIVFDKIKYAYDAADISFQVLLGSSQIQLIKGIRESLAGRVFIYELWPLMMKELLVNEDESNVEPPLLDGLFSEKPLSELLRKIPSVMIDRDYADPKAAENHLLRWGGMPALLYLSNEERVKWLRDYGFTYLERDLADLARLDDLLPFRKMQKLTALRSANLLNYSELARDAAISVQTARNYLQYLQISYQVLLLQPYYRNLTSSVIKTPKVYWLDVGMLRTLTGFEGEASGTIYETMVVSEFFKWMRTAQKNGELYFYRTRSGLEVDLLLQTSSGLLGMEIKMRDRIFPSDITALKKLARVLGNQWRGGLVIYRGKRIFKIDEPDIWAVPSWRLFT